MRLSIGDVWDRTTDVLRGRTGIIAPIAILAILLPNVASAAVTSFAPKSPSSALLLVIVTFLSVVATIWGTLAIIAVASDPATDRPAAQRQATARLLPALGIVLVLGAVLMLAVVPIVVGLMRGGVDFTRPDTAAQLSGGAAGFVFLYSLVLIAFAFWLSARLIVLNPVILNERCGLRSIPRSIELTQGMTWKLIALLILFSLVVLIPTLAVQAVVGVAVRLIVGEEGRAAAAFAGSAAGTVVTSAFSAIAAVFQAQLYVALRARRAG